MFTGDSSGDWLYRVLYDTGFASQPESNSIDDGMELNEVYITAIGRCAPPQNKPTTKEIKNCSSYLETELKIFNNLKVILCLGGLSFNRFCRIRELKGLKFGHGAKYDLPEGIKLVSSYHPSRQNTNTGKLIWADWLGVFNDVRSLISQ